MSVPVCVCVCVLVCGGVPLCQCGLGAEVTASCPPPLSLPLYSTIIKTKIQKEIRKPPLSLPLYNSVIINTKTLRPSTNQRTSSHFTITQSAQNLSQ